MHEYDWVISFFFNMFILRTLFDRFLQLPLVFSVLKGEYRLNTGLNALLFDRFNVWNF